MPLRRNRELDQLIEKYLRKETNEIESKIVEDYFDSFTSLPNVLDQAPWAEREIIKQRMQQKLMQRIAGNTSKGNSFPIHFRHIAAAAAILLVILSIAIYFNLPSNISTKSYEVTLEKGQQRRLLLEDGTAVILNASSKLIYPASFKNTDKREVTLIGEAYFDVAKAPNKPFLIHTPRMEIHVLGTAFNVRDYTEDELAETSLIQGKVAVWKTGEETSKVILQPKEKFVLAERAAAFPGDQNISKNAPKQVDVMVQSIQLSTADGKPLETEWLLKRITIKEESLQQIAQRLERMYGVKITISNPAIAKQLYSATFDHEQLDTILRALQVVAPFRYKKDDRGAIQIY